MNSEEHGYTPEEFNEALAAITQSLLAPASIYPSIQPTAVLLGDQSGAGKITLHEILKEQFPAIVINGDEYRSFHPHYKELEVVFGKDSVKHTAEWAGKMTEALIESFSSVGYSLIIEGTLRTAEVPLRTAELLRSRGHHVSLALMGVKPEISLISCQIRYELMRIAGTTPRATDPKLHNLIVHEIVNNLSVLEESGLFDSIRIYARDKKLLFPTAEETYTASEAMNEILFGPWTEQEKLHYEFLKQQLAKLKQE